jgi:hypothetical protein
MKKHIDSIKLKIGTYIDRSNIISDIFINYYLKFFNHNEFHFLILDKNFDGVSDYLKTKGFSEDSFEKVENSHIGVPILLKNQNSFVKKYTSEGFITVYVDIDEILYHSDLRNFIINNDYDFITPKGVVIIPHLNEDVINEKNKILDQRSFCVLNDEYHSKVTVLRKEIEWSGGRHNKNNNKIFDNIFLIDISKCCPKIMLDNNITSNHLYSKSTERYSMVDQKKIEDTLDGWRKRLTKLPDYIIDSKLF